MCISPFCGHSAFWVLLYLKVKCVIYSIIFSLYDFNIKSLPINTLFMFIFLKSGQSNMYLLVRSSWTAWQQHWLNDQWCVFGAELCVCLSNSRWELQFCFDTSAAETTHFTLKVTTGCSYFFSVQFCIFNLSFKSNAFMYSNQGCQWGSKKQLVCQTSIQLWMFW